MARPARPLQLDLSPSPGGEMDSRVFEENFRRLGDYFNPYGGGAPHLELLARFLGGQHFEGTVGSSSSTSGTFDTEFDHNLGRVPSMVFLSVPTDGSAGSVVGLPAGLQGAIGANVQVWTRTKIFVRATVTAAFEFLVL